MRFRHRLLFFLLILYFVIHNFFQTFLEQSVGQAVGAGGAGWQQTYVKLVNPYIKSVGLLRGCKEYPRGKIKWNQEHQCFRREVLFHVMIAFLSKL